MATIKYKLTFYSDWHCGSGLSAGTDIDTLTVKDKDGFPFVPGKTIKGLLRECMFYIIGSNDMSQFDYVFGYFDDKDKKEQGCAFFSNAEITSIEREIIKVHNAQKFLFREISSTAINKNGIAKDYSLRKKEVVIPCILEGTITHIPEEMVIPIEKGLKMIKRLGLNRTRGLGRCDFHEITKL